MSEKPDILRLRQEYHNRKTRMDGKHLYSGFNPAYLYTMQHLERDLLRILRQKFGYDISQKSVLEIGCGTGGVLLDYLVNGANPTNLYGIDLLLDKLVKGRSKLPNVSFINANGEYVPFTSSSFDLVLQYTAFSSILDVAIKKNMAEEMLRVLKKDGIILWYDFWWNPTNKQTKGIKPTEIKELFPGSIFHFKKITLAPPIARKIVHYSWVIAEILESLRFLNSHYLVLIQKK